MKRDKITCKSTGETVYTYSEYLCTKHWEQIRAEAYAIHGHKCAKCGQATALNMHHKTYVRIGCENILHDLVPLCRYHHLKAHNTTAQNDELLLAAKRNDDKMRKEHGIGKRQAEWLAGEQSNILRIIRNSHYNGMVDAIKTAYYSEGLCNIIFKSSWYAEMSERKRKSGGHSRRLIIYHK